MGSFRALLLLYLLASLITIDFLDLYIFLFCSTSRGVTFKWKLYITWSSIIKLIYKYINLLQEQKKLNLSM
jgi:hypothetical protein